MTKIIEVQNVSVHYTQENMERVCAVDSVNLSVCTNEHIAIIGENGSGKSTLLRVLRGEIYPDQVNGGQVIWHENGIAETSPLSGRNISSLISPKIQDYYSTQAWNVTCLEIILAAKTNDYILYKSPLEEEIQEAYRIAKDLGTDHLLYAKIADLSQGQLRIILIARALMRKTPIILLDEATNGLDTKSQTLVLEQLENLAHNKNLHSPSIIMTTHRTPLPLFITKAYAMAHGRLSPLDIQRTAPQTTLLQQKRQSTTENQSSKKIVSEFTGVSAPLLAFEKGIVHSNRLLPNEDTKFNGLYISLKKADVYINQKKILHEINWEIEPCQQWAVKGKNGSGKSTLLKVILGFLPVALGGQIKRTFYTDTSPHGIILSELDVIKRHIRIVSDALQTHYTYNDTVEDIVFSGLDGNIGMYRKASKEEDIIVDECINKINLGHLRKRPLRSLSTGQARKTLLARALVGKPSLLLLDEPFSGLDQKSCSEIIEILEEQILQGVQTLLVSHHDSDFLPSTTHFASIEKGKLTINE